MCPAPEPRSRTMPALPSLGFDLGEEPATGYAFLAEPSFEDKHHEPDQDQKFAVSAARTFLEVMPDLANDEIARQQLRSFCMPILPSCGLDVEKELDEDSFGAVLGQEASDPILRCTPILPETETEPKSQMTPAGQGVARPGREGRVRTRLRFSGRAELRRQAQRTRPGSEVCCKGGTDILGGHARCDRR